MNKSVLLVLLCLQAFLLITAFTSADAAALVKDGRIKLPSHQGPGTSEKLKRVGCSGKPGGCGILKLPDLNPKLKSHLEETKTTSPQWKRPIPLVQ